MSYSQTQPLPPARLLKRVAGVIVLSAAAALGLGYVMTRTWFASVPVAGDLHRWPATGLMLAGVCGVTTANLFLRWLRWHLVLRRLGMPLATRGSILLYVSTLPAILTPLRLGELVRAVLLGRRYPRFRLDAAAVWVLERTTDLLVLAVFTGLLFRHPLLPLAALAWMASIVLVRWVYRARHGRTVLSAPTLAAICALSTVAWFLPALALTGLLAAMGSRIAVLEGLTLFAHSTVFGNLTGLPGGVGLAGSSLINGLRDAGVPLERAIHAVFRFRLGTTWFAVLLGLATAIAGWKTLRRFVTTAAADTDTTHFDRIADAYGGELPQHVIDRLLERKVACMQERFASEPRGESPPRGLDLGCGQGWYAARMASDGYRMHAVDVAPEQVAHAKTYLARRQCAVECTTMTPGVLPFPDNHFDFAYSINVFHHITDPDVLEQTWQEVIRVLKPGGRFFLHEINVTNPLFRFYVGYVYPIIRAIDEGTEEWIEPHALPELPGASWQADIAYFTFLPDFLPRWATCRLAPLETRLEHSRWRHWSAHYMACLKKNGADNETARGGTP